MKKMKIILSSTLLGIGLLMACQSGISPEQEDKLVEFQSRIDSSLAVLNQVDTAKSLYAANHYFDNIRYVQQEMADTIDKEMAFFIDRYYSMRKAFKLFGKRYPIAYHELQMSKKQVADLIHDAEAGLLKESEVQKYIQLEGNNLALAEESVNEIIYAIQTVQPMYDEMNPRIDSLVEATRNKKKNP